MIEVAIKNLEYFQSVVWDGKNVEEIRLFVNESDISIKDNDRILVESFHEPFWILKNDIVTKDMTSGKLRSYSAIDFHNAFRKPVDPNSEKKEQSE